MDDKLIDKIQKLLALATSPVEAEARAAAEKANELLIRHNLTMQDVADRPLDDYEKTVLSNRNEMASEDKWLLRLLQKHFFVKAVKHRQKIFKKTVIYMVGEKTNTKVAAYVYEFLLKKFRELWKEYRIDTGCPETSRQSYYDGLYLGLDAQLSKTRKVIEDEKGLVVIEDPMISKAMKEFFREIGTASMKMSISDREAQSHGRVHGESIRIQRGIESKSGNMGKYLK